MEVTAPAAPAIMHRRYFPTYARRRGAQPARAPSVDPPTGEFRP